MSRFTKIIVLILVSLPATALAQEPAVYKPLVNILGGETPSFDAYINLLYTTSITLAALLAVVKIIIAGAKYMLSDVISNKGEALGEIKGALLGLLLIVGAYLILNVINPQLLTNDLTGSFNKIPVGTLAQKSGIAPAQATADNNERARDDMRKKQEVLDDISRNRRTSTSTLLSSDTDKIDLKKTICARTLGKWSPPVVSGRNTIITCTSFKTKQSASNRESGLCEPPEETVVTPVGTMCITY
jgi:hypothetical protein